MLTKIIPTDPFYMPYLLLSLLLLPLFINTEQVNAQNLQRMSIEREEASTGIPVFTQYPDKAGIVIESSVPGLRFSSNMQGIVEVKEPASGRYVLIIETFTQIIRVDAENFVQERFRVGNPQARDVLYFSVMPEQQQADLVSVIFNVEPDDALLFLNGQQVEANSTIKLPEQGYELRLEREGYRSINEIVNVSPDDILFNYTMEEIEIMPVRIRANVEGAAVIVDGTERGTTDIGGSFEFFMFPGSYALTVSKTGYLTENRALEVSERGTNQLQVELRRNAGDLVLQTEPGDARIMLNRQDFTGEGRIELAPGRYRLEVEKQNYEPYNETIEIKLNEELQRNIELESHTGSLQFSISPSSSNVELIDASDEIVQEWSGIRLLRNLNAGRYTLKASADGHLPEEQQIRIRKDETLEISLELGINSLYEKIRERLEEHNSDPHAYHTEVVEVTNPITGRTWMDRNLGAADKATTKFSYSGYLYQWGRATDGHQFWLSETTDDQSNSYSPFHDEFIIVSNHFDGIINWKTSDNNDLRQGENSLGNSLRERFGFQEASINNLWQGENGVNNPCPDEFRLPTIEEWKEEIQSWISLDVNGGFSSMLKLPFTGFRNSDDGALISEDELGVYWSSTVEEDSYPHAVIIRPNDLYTGIAFNFASGVAVRCIKD